MGGDQMVPVSKFREKSAEIKKTMTPLPHQGHKNKVGMATCQKVALSPPVTGNWRRQKNRVNGLLDAFCKKSRCNTCYTLQHKVLLLRTIQTSN